MEEIVGKAIMDLGLGVNNTTVFIQSLHVSIAFSTCPGIGLIAQLPAWIFLQTVHLLSIRTTYCQANQRYLIWKMVSSFILCCIWILPDSHHPFEIKSSISYIVVSSRETNFICCFNINICDLYSRQCNN